MKLIFQYMSRRIRRISLGMAVKILAAFLELLIPYVLEYIIDQLAPKGQAGPVVGWGLAMAGLACAGAIFLPTSPPYMFPRTVPGKSVKTSFSERSPSPARRQTNSGCPP